MTDFENSKVNYVLGVVCGQLLEVLLEGVVELERRCNLRDRGEWLIVRETAGWSGRETAVLVWVRILRSVILVAIRVAVVETSAGWCTGVAWNWCEVLIKLTQPVIHWSHWRQLRCLVKAYSFQWSHVQGRVKLWLQCLGHKSLQPSTCDWWRAGNQLLCYVYVPFRSSSLLLFIFNFLNSSCLTRTKISSFFGHQLAGLLDRHSRGFSHDEMIKNRETNTCLNDW